MRAYPAKFLDATSKITLHRNSPIVIVQCMFGAILERSSVIIYKFGMPAVYFYHVILGSTFLNTAAEDAQGFERLANQALSPCQYFWEGKKAVPHFGEHGEWTYTLERRFDYDNCFFFKTAASMAMLPISITVGSALKGLAYLSSETRLRADKIRAAQYSRKVELNSDYYTSVGLQVNDWREAEMIDPPRWKANPNSKHQLEKDVQALAEITQILSDRGIIFWIDCGTCLGCYQYGGVIPHDWDIDIGILKADFENVKNALHDLDPEKYVVQDWSGRALPKSYLKVFVRETGGMIDLYNFVIDEEKKQIATILSNEFNIFLPNSWKVREKRYCTPMPFSNVFPLKKALFEGLEVPVPGKTEKYLQVFYGENLAPAKIYNEVSGIYENDQSHPYWQLPNAH